MVTKLRKTAGKSFQTVFHVTSACNAILYNIFMACSNMFMNSDHLLSKLHHTVKSFPMNLNAHSSIILENQTCVHAKFLTQIYLINNLQKTGPYVWYTYI